MEKSSHIYYYAYRIGINICLKYSKSSFKSQVRSDLAAIPMENTDKNYVDKWLEQQLEKYAEEKEDPGLVARMRRAMKFGLTTQTSKKALKHDK
jgi:hypothetical protein